MELPTGTVTFLFTDIEGSTRLWEQHPDAMREALARHDALLRTAIETNGGSVFKTVGDQFCAAFVRAPAGVAAALAAQHALHAEEWVGTLRDAPLRVRMALHTGAVEHRDGDYFGPPLNRVARLLDAGHGGQTLLTETTANLVRDTLPEAATLRDLGAHRLKDLHQPEHLFQLVDSTLPAAFPPLRSLEAFAHNLPAQLTRFIGREHELAEVKRLLGDTRLLTLTGAGGCGKTRLALQVAAELVEEYADGVWLVELAALSESALMPQSVATTLGVREEPGQPITKTLTDFLRSRSLLLLLDNCEHLLAACAHLAESLLRACPQVRILASSREGIGIVGETTYRLPPLSVPDERPTTNNQRPTPECLMEYEAIRLFVDRATAALSSFSVTNENAPAVAQVCQRLDGIPLAIELAAARVRALPVEKIADRLDDRFRLLTGGSRTALPRQHTLRALIDWSYDLLSQAEQALLRRLCVFAGGWTLEAAEAVCAVSASLECEVSSIKASTPNTQHSTLPLEEWEVIELLAHLVEKSLVVYEEHGGEARYRLLETVRQYARERLLEEGEAEQIGGRHQDWFLMLAEQAEPELEGGPHQIFWFRQLGQEQDNLRAALRWALDRDAEGALRLAGALFLFWLRQASYAEGQRWLEEALAKGSDAAPTLRAKALFGAAILVLYQDDTARAVTLAEQGVAIARESTDQKTIARSLICMGFVALEHGDLARAKAVCEEGLLLAREVGDRRSISMALYQLARLAVTHGECEGAIALLEEDLALSRSAEDKRSVGGALRSLGGIALLQGDLARARSFSEESLAVNRELDFQDGISHAAEILARIMVEQGDSDVAEPLLVESLTLFHKTGSKICTAHALEAFARLALAGAHPERAACLLGAAEALLTTLTASLTPVERALYDRTLTMARGAMDEAVFAAAWAKGRALTLERAITYALEVPSPVEPGLQKGLERPRF